MQVKSGRAARRITRYWDPVMNDDLKDLGSLGFTLPSPAYIFGAILFGLLGFSVWRYGRKASRMHPQWIGIVLMLYPYVVSETWLLYGIGSALCVALYVLRE